MLYLEYFNHLTLPSDMEKLVNSLQFFDQNNNLTLRNTGVAGPLLPRWVSLCYFVILV